VPLPEAGAAGLLPPMALSAERPILRLMAKHGSGSLGSWRAGPDPARVSTALFLLLGSRPFTNFALLDELIVREGQPMHGRELAAAIARRLDLPASELTRGGNYMDRVRPSLHALLELDLLERTSSLPRARGRPQPFRLREDRVGLVRSVLEAFRSGVGLRWLDEAHLGQAEVHLQRARRQSWERMFEDARTELAHASHQLGLAKGRSPGPRVGLAQAEMLRDLADVLRSQGSHRAAQSALRSAAARFRALGAVPELARAVLEGQARTLSLLGELELLDGSVRRGTLDLEAGRAAHRARAELPPTDWALRRNALVAEFLIGEAALLAGDPARAIAQCRSASTGLVRLEEDPTGAFPAADRANLAMNRSRAWVIESIACAREGNDALSATVHACREASRAVELTAGRNGVHWRRLGIALRVRSAVLFLDSRDSRRLPGLLARAATAFERSLALNPGEADSLYEYSRLHSLARAARPAGGRDLRLGGGSEIYRRARRSGRDHPANRLDPTMGLRAPQTWLARASWARTVRWLLPSA
jgi:hypothetical protein